VVTDASRKGNDATGVTRGAVTDAVVAATLVVVHAVMEDITLLSTILPTSISLKMGKHPQPW
jgi:hypothetical protein